MPHYPNDIVLILKKAWAGEGPAGYKRPQLPPFGILTEILDTCYHASFLREEGRQAGFRVIWYSKKEQVATSSARRAFGILTNGLEPVIEFSSPRPFVISELNKLSPVARAERSLICIDGKTPGEMKMWGLIDTGDSWWNLVHHGIYTNSAIRPPPNLTVSSLNPGELILSSAGEVMLTLRGGKISGASRNTLQEIGVSGFLDRARKKLHSDACAPFRSAMYAPSGDDNEYPTRLYNSCLSRILQRIQEANHGGTLIVIPDSYNNDDAHLRARITIKYPCNYDQLWRLLISYLISEKLHGLLDENLSEKKKTFKAPEYIFASAISSRSNLLNELITNCCNAISSLSAVDGAVVITDRFRVLGFGGEVTVTSPKLKAVSIRRQGVTGKPSSLPIEVYGTRHRSAFRFCASFKDAITFIVSQDGGIKAVTRSNSKVTLWPDVSTLNPIHCSVVLMKGGKTRIIKESTGRR